MSTCPASKLVAVSKRCLLNEHKVFQQSPKLDSLFGTIQEDFRHSDNVKWLWFLPMLWSMYTIYCNLYYIYSYTLTVSMSAKMYMEGKINYNYNVCTLIKIFFSVYRLVPGWWDFSDVNQSKSTIKSASFLWLQGNLDSGGSNFSSAAALALEK